MNGFRDAGWTVSTVIAVDTSRSMKRYLAPVRAALPDFIAKLPQNDTVALITFDDDVHPGRRLARREINWGRASKG